MTNLQDLLNKQLFYIMSQKVFWTVLDFIQKLKTGHSSGKEFKFEQIKIIQMKNSYSNLIKDLQKYIDAENFAHKSKVERFKKEN